MDYVYTKQAARVLWQCDLYESAIKKQTQQNKEAIRRKTSLLRRLQEQTLPDEAPPMGKIHPFSKIAVTFEPVMRF